jgi:S-adenosylmethionine synthetase
MSTLRTMGIKITCAHHSAQVMATTTRIRDDGASWAIVAGAEAEPSDDSGETFLGNACEGVATLTDFQ